MRKYKNLDTDQQLTLVDKVKGILEREYSRTLHGTGPVEQVSIWTEDRWHWVGTVVHANGLTRQTHITVLGLVDNDTAKVHERGSGEHEVFVGGNDGNTA